MLLRPEDHYAMPPDGTSRDISGKGRHVVIADCPLELRYGLHILDSLYGIWLVRGHVDGSLSVDPVC